MQASLILKQNDYLTNEERYEIDQQIENIILKHKGNSLEINKLVFESVTALTASEARSSELSEQGFLKRFLGGLTGKNQKLQSEIDNGLARAQYASQQTLQKLAEQNLMSFELITAVNNKLNSSIIEIESEINKIYETLIVFFKKTKSDIVQLETRVERLEKNVNLLNWLNTIEYQMYNEIEYNELNKIDKIVCLVRDFYDITKGNWTTSDLLLLKSAISEIGLSTKEDISYMEFIKYVSENKDTFNRLVQEDDGVFSNIHINECILINGLGKAALLESDERYIINSVKRYLKDNGIVENDIKLKYSILKNYIEERTFIDIDSKVNLFDFMAELLLNIKTAQHYIWERYVNAELDFENMDFDDLEKYSIRGNKEAQFYCAKKYHFGDEVEADYEKAIELYKLSAKQGNAKAKCNLGYMYENGQGVKKDYKEAIKWYKFSAEQRNARAQCNLGYMYRDGKGIEQNYEEAIKWFELSAEQGNSNGQSCLAYMYTNGLGVDINYEKGLRINMLAAEQGNCMGQDNIGWAYYYGKGVAVDKQEAHKWFKKAAEQGDEWAKDKLKELYNES